MDVKLECLIFAKGLAAITVLLALWSPPGLMGSPPRLYALDVTGIWDMTVESQEGTAHPFITLKQEGNKISGVYEGKMGASQLAGTIQGSEIRFSINLKFQDVRYTVTYSGTVDTDTMKGTVRFGATGSGTWSAKRRKSAF